MAFVGKGLKYWLMASVAAVGLGGYFLLTGEQDPQAEDVENTTATPVQPEPVEETIVETAEIVEQENTSQPEQPDDAANDVPKVEAIEATTDPEPEIIDDAQAEIENETAEQTSILIEDAEASTTVAEQPAETAETETPLPTVDVPAANQEPAEAEEPQTATIDAPVISEDTVEMEQPQASVESAEIAAPVGTPVAPTPALQPLIAEAPAPDVVSEPDVPQLANQPDSPVSIQPTMPAPQLFSATTLTLQTVVQPDAAPDPDLISPSFDIVRVDANGSTLVAGQAAPNAVVNIISGGEIIANVTASERGEFVAFLTAPIKQPGTVELDAGVTETEGIVSQAQIIILPSQLDDQNDAPIVVLATQDSVKVIQPSGLSVPDNISLDTISYNEAGAVVLAGRGTPNRMARIYANGAFLGAASISDSGSWGLSLASLEAGRYILRVDEVNLDGSVASRVESPFQREFPEALALSEFAQGAKVIVQPGNTLWLMATQAYGDGDYYTQIFAANKDAIRDPDLIYPGQIVSIPNVEE